MIVRLWCQQKRYGTAESCSIGLQEAAVFQDVNSSLQTHAGPWTVPLVVNALIVLTISYVKNVLSWQRIWRIGQPPQNAVLVKDNSESLDVCCVASGRQNSVNLLQSGLTKDDCLLISGRGLHTREAWPCRYLQSCYMHARWTAEWFSLTVP